MPYVLFLGDYNGGERPYKAGEIVQVSDKLQRSFRLIPKDKRKKVFYGGRPAHLETIWQKHLDKIAKDAEKKATKTNSKKVKND